MLPLTVKWWVVYLVKHFIIRLRSSVGLEYLPVTQKVASSSLVGVANKSK